MDSFAAGAIAGNELCNHPEIPSSKQYEACGENLQCKVRVNTRGGPPEARCECNDQTEMCGRRFVSFKSGVSF
ncbi:unnamed protein product [Rotaria sordida]|uniref:Uncharacterized protein n=1 Tax=Rotaria sordida TaxID=392033 RepID=A0A814VT75_9BILA|nr:unnamed protein product [Rotaria sordida]